MPVLRDHYYKLASELPQEQIEAAAALLSDLGAADETAEWDYALNRLIKGLTTSRQSARFGFSMALTELVRKLVLKETYELTLDSFLEKVVEASLVSSSMKGKELRSVLFGRLFGLQALLKSKLLFEDALLATLLIKFVALLVELSSTKSWLRETAMYTLCEFVAMFLTSELYSEEVLVLVLQSIHDHDLSFTTEGLAVYLTIPQPLRSIAALKISSSKPNWKNDDPLSRGNLPTLAKVLKDVDAVTETDEEDPKKKNSKQKGTWSPRIPFVWDLLVKHYTDDSEEESIELATSSKKRKKSPSASKKKAKVESTLIPFKEFWKVVVDETMFAEKSSPERKYWGFDIFTLFLRNMDMPHLEHLFTPNLMRCLINQSAQSNRLLNKVSTKTLNTIIEVSKNDISKVTPILSCIIDESRGGCWNFDPITKSKVTDALIGVLGYIEDPASINESQVSNLVTGIKDVLITKFNLAVSEQTQPENDTTNHKKSNDNVLKWVLDKLLVLQRSTKRFSPSSKVLDDIFKFLVQHAFFKSTEGNSVSGNTAKLAQDRLNSFLSEVISQKRKDHSWSLYCVKQIEKLEKDDDYELILELADELQTVKLECVTLLGKIKSLMKEGTDASKEQQYCFELLFSMVLIQLYTGEAETVTVLEELKACYEDTFNTNDAEVETSTVLTEIILSFVSRKSTLLKKLSTIVWESFLCMKGSDGAIMVNEDCFKLLFDVLESKENEEGQKSLFDEEEEYEGEEEDEDEEEETTGINDEAADDEDLEEEDEEELDEELNLTAKVDKDTTIKLAKALGIPTQESGEVKYEDLDSFGEDDDVQSDSMDDEQMMAMDDELSRIFVERRNLLSANSTNKKKAEMVQAKEQMILFKNRVLDLIESFSKVQPNSLYNLAFIKPIVNLVNLTHDKNLGVKAHKILKTRVSRARVSTTEFEQLYSTEEEQNQYKQSLLDLVSWLQEQAGTYSSNQAHSLACGQSCIIVSKSLLALDSQFMPQIIAVYSENLTKWATDPKSRIQASMFFDFINWLGAKRSNQA